MDHQSGLSQYGFPILETQFQMKRSHVSEIRGRLRLSLITALCIHVNNPSDESLARLKRFVAEVRNETINVY